MLILLPLDHELFNNSCKAKLRDISTFLLQSSKPLLDFDDSLLKLGLMEEEYSLALDASTSQPKLLLKRHPKEQVHK